MDEELKTYLDAKFAEIGKNFAGVDARFAQIDARFAQIDARFAQIDARFTEIDARFTEVDASFTEIDARFTEVDAKFAELRAHVSEECEKVETKLLGEFWKWGRTSDMRTRQALAENAALGERMLAVEDRITALERKSAS
jgi:chromosome segregation ATPase